MAQPGYYPDPDTPSRLRFFDGEQWTDDVIEAPEPAAEQQPRSLGEPLVGAVAATEAALRRHRRSPIPRILLVAAVVGIAAVAVLTGAFGLNGADTPGAPQGGTPTVSTPVTSAPVTP